MTLVTTASWVAAWLLAAKPLRVASPQAVRQIQAARAAALQLAAELAQLLSQAALPGMRPARMAVPLAD
jgi:uncharacterized protein YcbX